MLLLVYKFGPQRRSFALLQNVSWTFTAVNVLNTAIKGGLCEVPSVKLGLYFLCCNKSPWGGAEVTRKVHFLKDTRYGCAACSLRNEG